MWFYYYDGKVSVHVCHFTAEAKLFSNCNNNMAEADSNSRDFYHAPENVPRRAGSVKGRFQSAELAMA